MAGPVAEDGAAPSRIMIKFDSGMLLYPIAAAICAASIFAIAPPAQSAQDGASAWADSWGTSVRLISAGRRVGDEDTLNLGLEFKLERGWFIYWKNPTGFSYHPVIDPSGSRNISDFELQWPMPSRITVFGQTTLGYEKEVVLPVVARVIDKNTDSYISTEVKYLACSEICVPSEARFEMIVPAVQLQTSRFESDIARFARSIPQKPSDWGVSFVSVEAGQGKKPLLRVIATSSIPFASPDLFVGGPDTFQFSKPRVTLADNGRKAIFDVPTIMVDDYAPDNLQGKKITLLLADQLHRIVQIITVSTDLIDQNP
jgi:suppressor for copper-sensitivity B